MSVPTSPASLVYIRLAQALAAGTCPDPGGARLLVAEAVEAWPMSLMGTSITDPWRRNRNDQ